MKARLEDLQPGSVIIADNSFTCMRPGPKVVQINSCGDLFVYCDEGEHILDGQLTGSPPYLFGFTLNKDD